jgi:hypothetical protein
MRAETPSDKSFIPTGAGGGKRTVHPVLFILGEMVANAIINHAHMAGY